MKYSGPSNYCNTIINCECEARSLLVHHDMSEAVCL